MKITYYVRDPREGNFSLEKIFRNIGEELGQNHEVRYYYVNSRKSKFWNILSAAKQQGDINHITGDVNWLAFGLKRKKTILTAHDLGHYENTLKGIRKKVYGKLWWEWPIKKVAMITAISEFTQERLIENFNVSSSDVRVVYDPLDRKFQPVPRHFNEKKPAILQVGSMPNKNVENLIIALKNIPCKLHLLRRFDARLKDMMDDLKIEHEFHVNLSEKQVVDLYSRIDLLYFASTYEGFGLPIIESQAIGRPVITSSLPPMPEVAGEGAHFVNPYRIDEIQEAVKTIVKNIGYRQKLVDAGYENVQRFRVEKISGQYLSIYKSLLKE